MHWRDEAAILAVVLLSLTLPARAEIVDLPASIPQGDTLHVKWKGPGAAAVRFGDQTARLFRDETGYLALVPVSALTDPGSYPLEVLDGKGQTLQQASIAVADARFPTQNIRVSKSMSTLKPLPGEIETIRGLQQTVSDRRFWAEPFHDPTPDCMNSVFGVMRLHNGKPSGNYHRGVDLRSPAGRPIRATAGGRVAIAKMYRLNGGTVGIDHGQGVISLYIHMSKIVAREGAIVKPGQIVGEVGSTGFATGPHLHWAIYVNGIPVNPLQWTGAVPQCQ